MKATTAVLSVLGVLAALAATQAFAGDQQGPVTVEAAYPGLLSGVLASAALADLPPGVLLRIEEDDTTQAALEEIIAGSAENIREQLRKNSIFVLREVATRKLLLRAAQDAAAETQQDLAGQAEPQIISDYLQAQVADVTISDDEVLGFYRNNEDMFGGATLDEVRATLGQYLTKKKRQEAVDRHIQGLGGAYNAVVSASWFAEQAVLARDNPVDKARASGRPTLVDFGAEGCRPCDMMAPILERFKHEYAGKANVIFVHVQHDQVLATRYGIRSIPVQVFFDAEGREVFRHTGFFGREEIQEKLAELGAK
ncbi:MAG: thioredoxin family protein [Planctomycetota bacterium]